MPIESESIYFQPMILHQPGSQPGSLYAVIKKSANQSQNSRKSSREAVRCATLGDGVLFVENLPALIRISQQLGDAVCPRMQRRKLVHPRHHAHACC